MAGTSALVIGITAVLYLISFGLALGAMTRRSQGKPVVVSGLDGLMKCQYTSDVATGLAAVAFIFLFAAQILIMVVTRCLCCGSGYKAGTARTFGVLVFIFSWLSFIVAAATLTAGAAQNKIHTNSFGYLNGVTFTCAQVRKSLFAASAAFTFLTMLWSEAYYVLISKARDGDSWQSYGGGAPPAGASYT